MSGVFNFHTGVVWDIGRSLTFIGCPCREALTGGLKVKGDVAVAVAGAGTA